MKQHTPTDVPEFEDRRDYSYDDEHTRQVVRMTVHEIFDGVGVDLSTPEGRTKFRETVDFASEAAAGTKIAKKTVIGLLITGLGYGLWKGAVPIVIWLSK